MCRVGINQSSDGQILLSVISEMCVASEPPKFSEKALHPLPNGIGCDRIRFSNLLAGVSIELDLNEKIDLRVTEQSVGNASMKVSRVPHGVP